MKRATIVLAIAAASIGVAACSGGTSATPSEVDYRDPVPGYQDLDPAGHAEEQDWYNTITPIQDEANRAMASAESAAERANQNPNTSTIREAGLAAAEAARTLDRAADLVEDLAFPERYQAAQTPLATGYRVSGGGYATVGQGYRLIATYVESDFPKQDDLDRGQRKIGLGASEIDRGFTQYTQKARAILWDA